MTYTEGVELLKKAVKEGHKFENNNIEWGMDLQSEHERYLTEEIVKGPLFLTDYSPAARACSSLGLWTAKAGCTSNPRSSRPSSRSGAS